MSTDSWSWIFSLPINEAPANEVEPRSAEFAGLFEKYPEDYLQNESPRYFIENYLESLAKSFDLQSLNYIWLPFKLLCGSEISEVVAAYGVLLDSCDNEPSIIANDGWGISAEDIQITASLDHDEFIELVNIDRKNRPDTPSAPKLIHYLRNNQNWFRHIERSSRCALYVLYQH
ncbi:hypothetical protein [Chitinimonas sp.]|uniref:hypothetical protein n=1 Tax=Chitinimonas sp. TaxID=1934313 RepID=UPI0035B10823